MHENTTLWSFEDTIGLLQSKYLPRIFDWLKTFVVLLNMLKSVEVTNVLTYKGTHNFIFNDLTLMVGANGSGKTNLVRILYDFFETSLPEVIYKKDSRVEVQIDTGIKLRIEFKKWSICEDGKPKDYDSVKTWREACSKLCRIRFSHTYFRDLCLKDYWDTTSKKFKPLQYDQFAEYHILDALGTISEDLLSEMNAHLESLHENDQD